jgi:hypothetical protein
MPSTNCSKEGNIPYNIKKKKMSTDQNGEGNKGNNKITELRTIYKGKVKTHNYINRQNQSTTGKL